MAKLGESKVIKATYKTVKRDPNRREKVTKAVHEQLKRLLRDSIKEYIRAVAPHVRVDTGMSKASLLPLARMLRMHTEIKSTIKPKAASRKGSFTIDGVWQPDVPRTLAAGEASSAFKHGFNILYGSNKRPVFRFEYKITVWQFLINENGMGKSEAWQALSYGEIAMERYIKEHWVSYVRDALKYDRWRVL